MKNIIFLSNYKMGNMKILHLLLATSLCVVYTDAVECEHGWEAYKDEYCVRLFIDFLSYEEAKAFCTSQSYSVYKAHMVMVKDSGMQEFLGDLLKDTYEDIWLGGKFDPQSAQFEWDDGDPLTFTNWAEGYPRNVTDPDVCIQLRPRNAKMTTNVAGKWENAACQRRNLVICQRDAAWSLAEAAQEIKKLRKRLETTENILEETKRDLGETKQDLEETKQHLGETKHDLDATKQSLIETTQTLEVTNNELDATKENLELVNARVVPVGSIYIEYANQPSPAALWPTLGWEDVTGSYAGLFFRALGGGSESWGVRQTDCASRIAEMDFHVRTEYLDPLILPKSGWSEIGTVGYYGSGDIREGVRFLVEDCEVRPNNQAIRIWKRTA